MGGATGVPIGAAAASAAAALVEARKTPAARTEARAVASMLTIIESCEWAAFAPGHAGAPLPGKVRTLATKRPASGSLVATDHSSKGSCGCVGPVASDEPSWCLL
eukprot:988634-Prymnesium_polylepis.1